VFWNKWRKKAEAELARFIWKSAFKNRGDVEMVVDDVHWN